MERPIASSCSVNQNSDRLQAYIGTLLPQAADADEVFQQTSITLWRKFGEFRHEESFLAWARGVAFNLVRNFRTAELRRPILLGDDVLGAIAEFQPSAADQTAQRREVLYGRPGKTPQARPGVDRSLLRRHRHAERRRRAAAMYRQRTL